MTTLEVAEIPNDLPELTPAFRSHRLEWLSGSHEDLQHELQLVLLIQPNCPGCLLNALPVANAIMASDQNDFGIYCVSTAFEDFEYNTVQNARLLLEGVLVGESARILGPTTRHIPQMPFAHDFVVDRDNADEDLKEWAFMTLEENARAQLKFMHLSEERIEKALESINFSSLPEKLGELFWSVKAQGTPTWVLHGYDGRVLGVRFGYLEEEDIRQW
eukprot:CAMPEP_0202454484 /NCGR_PEP_ID=MMETSP1360-20130828/12201_1 /ASSEMBLY_ACC=CAM_ASM_000848 /TAXON_ID=515479 /ORGANISM="Licmophora paradoxa, Strain CCMP2313" /LENGTH=216 /DNA_ID=CAMNT_0049073809 /DNA_START=22 /DNA_END=669 /DNA_ORIENTATION=+